MNKTEREQLHIVKMLRFVARLGINSHVVWQINRHGKVDSCLHVDKFENMFYNSYYTFKDL